MPILFAISFGKVAFQQHRLQNITCQHVLDVALARITLRFDADNPVLSWEVRVRYVIAIVLLSTGALAQDGHFGHGHQYWHQDFYQHLVTPETKVSCCNLTDCRPTSGRTVGTHYEVKVDGAWITVLPNKVVKTSAPDHGYHVCAPLNFSGKPEHLYCVVLPPES